ncbi:MAG: sialate O-acetylesterase [Cyclobacteriaceae bacterium]
MIILIVTVLFVSCDDRLELTGYEKLVAPKIILVIGQSNTHSGEGLDSLLDAPQDGIYQLGRFGDNNYRISLATEPLEHHSRQDNKIGFALTFSKLLGAHLNNQHDILIVPCGSRGTGFIDNRWNRTNDLYDDAVQRVNTILNEVPESSLIAVLWHQGEKDVNNERYRETLDRFVKDIRTDLKDPATPFIMGGMVPYWVSKDSARLKHQEILKDTPRRHFNLGYADPKIPFRIEKVDNTIEEIHFDAVGQRELGRRYFEQFLTINQ